MNPTSSAVPEERPSPQDAFLKVAGALMMATGLLQFLFSLFGCIITLQETPLRESLLEGQIPFLVIGDSYLFKTKGILAIYLFFQVGTGVFVGLLTLLAGWLAISHRGRKFILAMVWLNLLYFPLGTTMSSIILMNRGPNKYKKLFS